jgi:hypothetical protein
MAGEVIRGSRQESCSVSSIACMFVFLQIMLFPNRLGGTGA